MNGKIYSDSEKDYIMSLILLGEDSETIARITGRSVEGIKKFRKQYNWLRKEWRFRKSEKNDFNSRGTILQNVRDI